MPGAKSVRLALDAARQYRLAFSLVTPVLVEAFLPRLQLVLTEVLPLFEAGDEVVVSDLGGIEPVHEIAPQVTIVAGRAISGQKRDSRIPDLKLAPEELDYFRKGSWYNRGAIGYLREKGIKRVELDNLLQGVEPLPAGLRGTLHIPYAMVTSSRNCPFQPDYASPCQPRCGEAMRLSSGQSRVSMLQAGNTQFLENRKLPENLPSSGIDRLVEHPDIPA